MSLSLPGWWLLDGGSVVPVLAMDITEGDHILDMCAAPGGKSLLMIQTNMLGDSNFVNSTIFIRLVLLFESVTFVQLLGVDKCNNSFIIIRNDIKALFYRQTHVQ